MDISRLQQQKTSERFQALEQFEKELISGKYPADPASYVDVLLSNMNDSNFKVIELSLECVQLLLENGSQPLRGQHFRIFSEAIQQFRSMRENVRQAAMDLAGRAATLLDEEELVEECDLNLGGKNATQKEFTLKLLGQLFEEQCFSRSGDKVERLATKMFEDAAPEVRAEAELLSQICTEVISSGGFEAEEKEEKLAKTSGVSRPNTQESTLSKTGGATKAARQPGKHNPQNSIFPPPENNDPEAESETFGIVPPEIASYYSYKPLYCYTLFEQLDAVISPIVPFSDAKSMRIEAFRQHIDRAVAMAANERDWIEEMTGIEFLIGVILLNLGASTAENQQLAQMVQENLLIQIQDINKTITSRRSVLQREMCILLEICVQRFGRAIQKLADLVLDTVLALLQMKGVYTETMADSLIKSIIVHAGSRGQMGKVLSQLKTSKNAIIKAHCIDYICLFMVTSSFDEKLQFWEIRDDIMQLIKRLASDANERVRVTVRGFVACCESLDPEMADVMLQESPNLLKMQEPEAGFLTYDNNISISIQDPEFPGYYLQSAACHSDIVPLAHDLERWRYDLVCGDEFVLTYNDLEDGSMMEPVSSSELGRSQYVESVPDYVERPQPTQERQGKVEGLKLDIDDFSGLNELKAAPKTTRALDKFIDEDFQGPYHLNKSATIEDMQRPETSKASKLESLRSAEDDDEIDEAVSRIVRQKGEKHLEEPQEFSSTVKFTPLVENGENTAYAPQKTAVRLSEVLQQVKAAKSPNETLSDLINKLTLNQTDPLPLIAEISPYISKYISIDITKSLIVLLLDFCGVAGDELQLQTVRLLNRVSEALPKAFADLLDFSLPIFVSMFRSPDLTVRKAVNELLLSLIRTQNERELFLPFALIVREETDVMADAGLRFLALSARKYASMEALKTDIEMCIYDIISLFGSESISVRKSAVSCFIDLCLLVGEDDFPYFGSLDAFQLKFVIERMKQIGKK